MYKYFIIQQNNFKSFFNFKLVINALKQNRLTHREDDLYGEQK